MFWTSSFHVTDCYSNTMALQPFIALNCVVMI